MSPSAIRAYLKEAAAIQSGGEFTEHSFRGALQKLLQAHLPGVDITNEPGRIMEGGAPDYVLKLNQIPLGYIEAKNIDKSLDDKTFRDQFNRYLQSLDNLIFTNYLEFRFYRDGETKPVDTVAIAELRGGKIKPLPENFARFENLIANFGAYQGQTITVADNLAKRMADKARLLAQVIAEALDTDEKNGDRNGGSYELQGQLKAFRELLDADIKPSRFAGIYAQTIAYGMFVARLHDPTPLTFTRHEAVNLIPGSNPFLKKFFGYIADYDLDARIRWLVDDLADIFRATDVGALMKDFGRSTQRTDPFIHFYETFLGKYDSRLRKGRGVYYTPAPAVNFIVRAVDEILKTEFKLPGGLADTAKTTVTVDGKKKTMHKVQILDPGTGTGTFLAEVVKFIYANFAHLKGAWHGYVTDDLLPRLNGFEILMAPYAMAHVKLEMILKETGFELGGQRLRIFLTNSLENREAETQMRDIPFANWLVQEARGADEVKRDAPVMVVMGNPPYAVSSSNRGKWIETQMNDYKTNLTERNIQPLSDDYVKFIRYGEHLIDKTGEGILAYISNNSFIDGLIHRRMREHLLQTFDRIYVLNLHGDTRKKERAPDGSKDQNVFDIMQGVSINLFVKTGKKKAGALGEVFYLDQFGVRQSKYEFLWSNALGKVKFRKLKPRAPHFFFVPKDFSAQAEYEKGFAVNKLFGEYNSGIKTGGDDLAVKFSRKDIEAVADDFLSLDATALKDKYYGRSETSGWNFAAAKQDLMRRQFQVANMLYRPFDMRWTLYATAGFISRPRHKVMRHMLANNIGIILPRLCKGVAGFQHGMVSKHLIDIAAGDAFSGSGTYLFPLYLYPDETQTRLDSQPSRKPNLNADIIQQIADKTGLRFTPEKTAARNAFAPVDILDYIYAALHGPTYRKKFREFLKIDFPRVPFPRDRKQFRALAKLGAELRALHLMESAKLNVPAIPYQQPGDNIVTTVRFDAGKVYINKTQHFAEVPQTAWEFYIGGYQPAQKYLKDRRDRALTWDEIAHYQKIIVALVETAKVMKQIDAVA